MSKDLTTTDQKPVKLSVWVARDDVHQQLVAAVGDSMDADQFIAHCLAAFQGEKVRNCSDESKFRAIHDLAALGMVPSTDMIALVPYKNEIKVTVQWQGMKALMERHADILEVSAQLVHVDDEFSIENGVYHHKYDPFDKSRQINGPKDLKGGYCKIVYRDGRPPKYVPITIEYITKCQKCAQTQKIWTTWYEQMATKTVYRGTYKRRAVPMDPLVAARMEKALSIEDVDLGNDPDRFHLLPAETVKSQIEQAKETAVQEADPPSDPPTQEEVEKHTPRKVHPTPDQSANAEIFSQRIADIASQENVDAITADLTQAEAELTITWEQSLELAELLASQRKTV